MNKERLIEIVSEILKSSGDHYNDKLYSYINNRDKIARNVWEKIRSNEFFSAMDTLNLFCKEVENEYEKEVEIDNFFQAHNYIPTKENIMNTIEKEQRTNIETATIFEIHNVKRISSGDMRNVTWSVITEDEENVKFVIPECSIYPLAKKFAELSYSFDE